MALYVAKQRGRDTFVLYDQARRDGRREPLLKLG
jgi:hypothetical protein